MSMCCERKNICTIVAVVLSVIVGFVIALIQAAAGITLDPIFAVITIGISGLFLLSTEVTVAIARIRTRAVSRNSSFGAIMLGIIGTLIVSVIALLVGGISYGSIGGAILFGLLGAFLTLMIASTVCFVIYLSNADD